MALLPPVPFPAGTLTKGRNGQSLHSGVQMIEIAWALLLLAEVLVVLRPGGIRLIGPDLHLLLAGGTMDVEALIIRTVTGKY